MDNVDGISRPVGIGDVAVNEACLLVGLGDEGNFRVNSSRISDFILLKRV